MDIRSISFCADQWLAKQSLSSVSLNRIIKTWEWKWQVKLLPVKRNNNKLRKILKETGISDDLTCLLRNLYAGQEATFRTGHGTTDWFQRGKSTSRLYIAPCLFTLYAEYIMTNAGLEEAQGGIKIAGRNINNLRYADDTILTQKVKKN